MTNFITRAFGSFKAGIATGVTVTLAVLLPITVNAQAAVKTGGSMGVANVTAGNTNYKQAVDATNDQVIKVQVYYTNNEASDSGTVAQNVRLKISLPATAGKSQVVKSSIKADNSNAIEREVTVNTARDDAMLQYIPGSAVWKHNTGTAEAQKVVETKIADDIVTSAQGIVAENQKPGEVFGATVTVLARVVTPGVKVTAQSQLKSDTNKWAASNTANPGDTLRFMIGYQNTGTSQQKDVLVRATLPVGLTLVPGTTALMNTTNPGGAKFDSDAVTTNGIIIGSYAAGANAFVTFEVIVAAADKLTCGNNDLRTVAVIRPDGMNEYYSFSLTNAKRDCAATPAPAPAPAAPVTPKTVTPTPPPAAPKVVTPAAPAPTPPAATPTPTAPTATPGALPNTGNGEMLVFVAAIAVVAAFGHSVYLTRKLSR